MPCLRLKGAFPENRSRGKKRLLPGKDLPLHAAGRRIKTISSRAAAVLPIKKKGAMQKQAQACSMLAQADFAARVEDMLSVKKV